MMKDAIRNLCATALETVKNVLPTESYREAHDLVHKHNEWGLAMEFIIDWIGDLALPINQAQLDAIERAMIPMGWAESTRMRWLRQYFTEQRT